MDYKEMIQQFADEIAAEKYDKDFYDLSEAQQEEVYEQAQERCNDHYASLADSMAEEMKYQK